MLTLFIGSSGTAIGVITIVCLAAYISSFGTTWGPIVWVMLPELYPLAVFCVLSYFFVRAAVPETAGKSLETLEERVSTPEPDSASSNR